ncbi:serine-rich adhesin for platelets-like [Littorina saxatilis]|uniref:serine-rich adhesin for platelets-like n=1 Tax=Littorina saxatilis TaxID=31220 RepID=UPI0038B623B1
MHKKARSFTLPQHPETALPSTPSCTSQEGTTSENLHLRLKPLRSKVRVQAFLNGIREDFINKVNVLEPGGFADLLIERGVLTETDNESIGAGHLPTPKEKARRVWTILSGIDHNIFVHDVLPVLCERHAHIIPESFWISNRSPHDSRASSRRGSEASVGVEGGGCTRCEIRRRLRPSTLADFLLKAEVMSSDVYSDLTRHQRITPDYVWDTIFRGFTKLSAGDAQRLQLDMTSLLTHHSLRVPDDIVDLMTEGFRCCCCCSLRSGTATRSMLLHLKTHSLRRPSHDSTASDTSSSTAYPSSETDVSISNKSSDSESLRSEVSHAPSRDLCDVAMPTRHPISSSVPEMTSSSNRGLSNLWRFLGELENRGGPDSLGLFLSGGAATGKMAPRSKREQLKMNQTWHGRRKASELKAVSSECWTGYGSTENLKNTTAVSRESLVSQVLRELDNAKSLQEPQSLADIKSSISDKTAARVQSPSGNSAVKISSDSQSQSQSVKVTTKTEPDSHSVLQSGITDTETNSDFYSVSQSDSTDVKTRTDSQSVSQPLMIETESKMDSQLPSPTPHKGDTAADRSTHISDISNPSKRQIAAPTPVQLKLSSTFTTKSGSAEQSSPRSSTSSRAVSSKESSVKLSSAKRQADVPSSLPLKSSSDIATEDLCVVQSSSQSPAGSRVSSEESSMKLSSLQGLSSPVSLFSSASSDDEKLKNFRKALTKGDYERHRSVLHGTAPTCGQEDDDVISHNDIISPDDVMVDVFFDEEDVSTRQPDSSGGDQSSRVDRLSLVSTSLDQRSTEGSHAGQDDFISQTVERVKKNRDLQEFRSIVASDVNSAEKLREKYSQAVITDDTAKEEIGQLLQAYTDMELLHSEIAEKLKTTTDRLRLDAEDHNSSPDTSEKAVSSEMFHLCSHIQDLCDDMLVSTRTFLLCAFHLNTQEQLTSLCTRTETEHVVHDVMVLLQLTSLEAWQSVQRLDEMRDQLCVGGASEEGPSLEEVISLVQTFLENS